MAVTVTITILCCSSTGLNAARWVSDIVAEQSKLYWKKLYSFTHCRRYSLTHSVGTWICQLLCVFIGRSTFICGLHQNTWASNTLGSKQPYISWVTLILLDGLFAHSKLTADESIRNPAHVASGCEFSISGRLWFHSYICEAACSNNPLPCHLYVPLEDMTGHILILKGDNICAFKMTGILLCFMQWFNLSLSLSLHRMITS